MKKDPDKMKRGTWKKVAAAGLCISMLLGGISLPNSIFTVEAADNTEGSEVTEEAPVQATFSEKVSDDKRKTEITFRVSYDESDVEIVRIETPDKTAAESKEEAAYTASENGNYDFTVVYREILSGKEKEETYTYTVTGLMAATAEDTTGTETEKEKTEAEKTSVARAAQSRAVTYPIAINEENFPDEVFRDELMDYSWGADGEITEDEIPKITFLNLERINLTTSPIIYDFTGIEYFTELESLDIAYHKASKLDVSNNPKLKIIECNSNRLETLTLGTQTNLETLYCQNQKLNTTTFTLQELDLSGCPNLKYLKCSDNDLQSLDVSYCPLLIELDCSTNRNMGEFNITGLTNLESLTCSWCNQESLDVSANPNLGKLVCSSNGMVSLNVRGLSNLKELSVYRNSLTEDFLDQLPTLTGLEDLNCGSNSTLKGNSVTMKYSPNLIDLDFSSCYLSQLDVSENAELTDLSCGYCQLTELDVTNNLKLETLYCSSNKLSELDLSKNTQLKTLYCGSNNQLNELDLSCNLLLETLDCGSILSSGTNNMTDLDVSKNTNLTSINCSNNKLTKLDLSKNTKITKVQCDRNMLSELILPNTTLALKCTQNKLTKITGGTVNASDINTEDSPNQTPTLKVTYDTALKKWKTDNNVFNYTPTLSNNDNASYNSTYKRLELSSIDSLAVDFSVQFTNSSTSTKKLSGTITFVTEKDIQAKDGVVLPSEAKALNSEIKNLKDTGLLIGNPESLLDGSDFQATLPGNVADFFGGKEGTYDFSYAWENIPAGSGTESASHTVRIVKEGSYIPDDRSWSMYAANISLGTSEAKDITAERLLELAKPEYAEVTGDVVTDLSKFSISTTDVNKVQNTQSGEVQIDITHTTSGNSREITVSVNQDDPIAMIVIPAEIELDPVDNSSVYEASKEAEVKLIDSLGQDFDKTIDIVASDSFDITDSGSGETLNCGVFVDGRKYDGASPLAKLSSSQNNQRFEVRAYKRLNITGDFKGTMNFTVSFAEGD